MKPNISSLILLFILLTCRAYSQMLPTYKSNLDHLDQVPADNSTQTTPPSPATPTYSEQGNKIVIKNPYNETLKVEVLYADTVIWKTILPYNETTLPRNENCRVLTSSKSGCSFAISPDNAYLLKYDEVLGCYTVYKL